MKTEFRIVVAFLAGLVTCGFLLVNLSETGLVKIGITSSAVLLVSLVILFLDRIFSGFSSEYALCIAGSGLIGLFAAPKLVELFRIFGLQGNEVTVALYVLPVLFMGYLGHEFAKFPGLRVFGGASHVQEEGVSATKEKILDTSVIIDGRILDIAETNFIEGPFIIPNFVLREIQLISDSPDPIKRNRGRRGLDMLNKLQQNGSVKVKISYADFADTREVDAKLVKLARETGGKLITNDFNLNKVAELQGVEVLNLNSLTNALKPVVLPGEEILIDVIKEGKDENQGIGYLEDGTMVVVENGRQLLNKTVKVCVTSIIQTAAGKMIFTRAVGVVDEGTDESKDNRDRGGRDRDNRDRGDNRDKRYQEGRRDRRDAEDYQDKNEQGGRRGFQRR